MSLLSVAQEFCRRSGFTDPPTYLIGNPDAGAQQIWGLANEVADDLCRRTRWTELTEESVFTSIAAPSQGLLSDLAPNGFLDIINQTIFDRTTRIPFYGPLNPQDWQARQALPATGPLYQYRIKKGQLYFNPTIAAGHTCAFEYRSRWIVGNASLSAFKSAFTADDDIMQVDENLLLLGLRWTAKREKNLSYAEEFKAYENAVAIASGADGGKPIISMDQSTSTWKPAVVVPLGNWNQP